MTKRIGVIVAAVFAVAVVFAGARTFACDGNGCKGAKTASAVESKSDCAGTSGAAMASDKSGAGCSAKAGSASGSHSCASKSGMSKAGCGTAGASKASFAANVYEVRDGHLWAVCNGKKFEVTSNTPYSEIGSARYYFADEASKVTCAEKMAMTAKALDAETVSLATVEGNVTTESDGRKFAVCPVSNDKFMVAADSPAKVMDGQKYYVCSDKCASQLMHTADAPSAN